MWDDVFFLSFFSQRDRVLDLGEGAAKCHFVVSQMSRQQGGNGFNLCECFNWRPSAADKYLKR